MKTTVEIPDTLFGKAKATAAEQGVPLKDLLTAAVREYLSNDLWIAALARQHQLPIATRDAHFRAVRGLRILAW